MSAYSRRLVEDLLPSLHLLEVKCVHATSFECAMRKLTTKYLGFLFLAVDLQDVVLSVHQEDFYRCSSHINAYIMVVK